MLKYILQYPGLILVILFILASCQSRKEESQIQSDREAENVKKVTIKDVERGIRANIDNRTLEGGGYFNFQKDTIDLSLKLVRVHTEYLSVLGPKKFFACVDLATENGDVYDMDFFLNGTADEMSVTRTDLHKLNGKPYYTWKQNKEKKTWYTIPVKNATNDLLGVVEGKDQFDFTYEVVLPEISGSAQMWIPIAQTDPFQTIDIVAIEAPGEQEMIFEEEYGNMILYIQLNSAHSGKKISVKYSVRRVEKSPYLEDDTDLLKYLEASALMPVGDRFSKIAEQTISEKNADTPLTKARALYDYIIDNMRYAKQGVYGTGDANYACDSKSGNCTEFHSFFISLARSAGIPARFAVGAGIPSERNDGEVDGYHCWAEFYAEGKWWPVDISEANKYTPLATYYFGHHPANRIEFSKGRDLTPEPTPNSGPINFLAYPVFEIEGEPGFIETTFSFERANPGT
jgi:transglutaminase-like putative cysteine protease